MEEPEVVAAEEQEEDNGSSGRAVEQASETGYVDVATSKKIDGQKREITLPLKVGRNMEEAIAEYGEEFVFDMYVRSIKIKFQGQVREQLEAGAEDEAIAEEFSGWDPTVSRTPTRDPAQQVLSGFSKLDAEDRASMLEQLRAQLEAAGA